MGGCIWEVVGEGGLPESIVPPNALTHSWNFNLPAWISFLAFSRILSSTSNNDPSSFFASRIPLSSNVSRIAPILYAGPSTCLASSFGPGISPSCDAERFPPGNTCAEGKALDVRTRWRRRIWFEGDIRRILRCVRTRMLGVLGGRRTLH